MDVKYYLTLLWRWSWLLIVASALAAGVTWWTSSQLPRAYRATATLMVGQTIHSTNPSAGDFATSQLLAQTYAQFVRRQPLLEATATALGLSIPWQALVGQVSALAVPQTQLIQISAISGDPLASASIANEVARQLILHSPTPAEKEMDERRAFVNRQLTDLQTRMEEAENDIKGLENRLALESSARGVQDAQGQIATLRQKIATWQATYANLLDFNRGGRVNNLSVVESAVAVPTPVSPNVPLSVLLGTSVGLLLALAAVLVVDYLDDTLKTSEDVARLLKLPTLGTLARFQRSTRPGGQLVARWASDTALGEAYRVLRTNVQCGSAQGPQTCLLITSAVPAEGKTTTACNLAVAVARSGQRVILCDADLRRPSVHTLFRVSNEAGLSTLLLDPGLPPTLVQSALVDSGVPGLRLLTSGPRVANPSDVLGSGLMARRLAELGQLADLVIVDSPAVLAVADATVLGPLCSEVILVVDAGKSRVGVVRSAKAALEQVGLRILGVVLNKAKDRRPHYHGYYATDQLAGNQAWPRRQLAGVWGRFVRRAPDTITPL